jgi:large subunit ribosomal protein L6
MSRVANNPVNIPEKVEVTINPNAVVVKGPLGELTQVLKGDVTLTKEDNQITFAPTRTDKHSKAMSGTIRALVANMVHGVSQGFSKKLTLVGVGYKAAAKGSVLNLDLGYSHPINHELPEGITANTPSQTEIEIKGVDKQVVGQVAAQIRAYRAPEPYKGKGVRYSDEKVVIKETKKK